MNDLIISVSGKILSSNFDEWKKDLLCTISSLNKNLETDEDFKEAGDSINKLSESESAIVEAKSRALQQAADVYKLFNDLDEISEASKSARLSLTKQIKEQKQKIKDAIYSEYYADCQKQLGKVNSLELEHEDFYVDADILTKAIKGKSSIESMRKSLGKAVKDMVALASTRQAIVDKNERLLEKLSQEQKPLFQDKKSLLLMETVTLEAEIKARIASDEINKLKLADQKRLDEEKQKDVVEAKADPCDLVPPSDAPQSNKIEVKNNKNIYFGSESFSAQEKEAYHVFVKLLCTKDQALIIAESIHNSYISNELVEQVRLKKGA